MQEQIKKGKEENYFTFKGEQYYMAPLLRRKLDQLIIEIKDDDDALILIFGDEGSGKSILAQQIGAYFSNNFGTKFDIDNIHFQSDLYKKVASHHSKGTVNILDEARRDIGKSNRGKEKNDFFNYLSECRDDNLIHIIILPAFSDISEFIALHRAKCIIRTQKKTKKLKSGIIKKEKGYYRLLKTKMKRDLYYLHEKKYTDPKPKLMTNMLYFPFHPAVDIEKYKEKKKYYKNLKYAGEQDDSIRLTHKQKEALKDLWDLGCTKLKHKSEAEYRRLYNLLKNILPDSE